MRVGGLLGSGAPPLDVATVYSRWHIIWKESEGLGAGWVGWGLQLRPLPPAPPLFVERWNRRGCPGVAGGYLESDSGMFVKRNHLDHSVPLPVGRRRQDGAGFQGKLRHVFRVFSYHWPYVSVLLVEQLGIGGTTLGPVRNCLARRFGGQAVLPVFRIVKGHLQLLPADFT